MPTDSDMPESWSRNARGRSAEITAAIERARAVRASAAPSTTPPAPAPATSAGAGAGVGAGPVDELAQRRIARLAAEDARRRFRPTDPPGPRTA